jgi:flagellar basal-body rod protein FlgB
MLDPTCGSLESYLTLVSARQRLVASNIANVDTPGYKTKDIDFNTELQNSLAGMSVVPEEVTGLITKNDGNNVDLDREARLLAENALHFTVGSNLIRSKLKLLKMAIEGGASSSS